MADLITEQDVLDYLMTSDFNDGLTQEESRFLLLKYKSLYRILHAKYEQSLSTVEEIENKLKINEENLNIAKSLMNNAIKDLENEKGRDLTWGERFSGKKKKKENEH